jgi:hypothetical protein
LVKTEGLSGFCEGGAVPKVAPSLERLIESIYEAAGAPELWPQVMSSIADAVKSLHANLIVWNHQENSLVVTAPSERMDPKANVLYEQHYSALDEAVPQLARRNIGEFFVVISTSTRLRARPHSPV